MFDNKVYQKDWYQRNREDQLERAKQRNREQTRRLHLLINAEKDKPCLDCGYSFPPECMDFDHVRGEKKFTIADAFHDRMNLDLVREEISKCDIVCANCHRIRTKQRTYRSTEQDARLLSDESRFESV